eukprot:COSAG04_NODE_3506_length_2762_cov_21.269137_3_plen_98_part_00
MRLFSGCEPEELPKDLAEELPKELRTVLTQKLQEKAEKTKTADAGAAVARARLWRGHVALTSKQLLWCVRHQCALLELKRSAIQRQRDLTYRYEYEH